VSDSVRTLLGAITIGARLQKEGWIYLKLVLGGSVKTISTSGSGATDGGLVNIADPIYQLTNLFRWGQTQMSDSKFAAWIRPLIPSLLSRMLNAPEERSTETQQEPGGSYRGLGFATVLVMLATGCSSPDLSSSADAELEYTVSCESCTEAIEVNGWCDRCSIGYVAALPIESALFHEVLDAHGHDTTGWTHPCLDCTEAMETDNFCRHCKFGFVDGMLYFSELTWSLARGKVSDRSKLSCASIRDCSEGTLWCEECQEGIVGNILLSDRDIFDRADREYQRLVLALAELDRCESCSISIFQGIACQQCGNGGENSPQNLPLGWESRQQGHVND